MDVSRSKIVIYDIEAGVSFIITENWDQSAGDLSVRTVVLHFYGV
jgi:hypothetical protein